MTKQTKTIEDYPELQEFITEARGDWDVESFYYKATVIEQKLLSMQSKIDSLTEQNKELQKRIKELDLIIFDACKAN